MKQATLTIGTKTYMAPVWGSIAVCMADALFEQQRGSISTADFCKVMLAIGALCWMGIRAIRFKDYRIYMYMHLSAVALIDSFVSWLWVPIYLYSVLQLDDPPENG